MPKKELLKRYLIFIIGIFINSFGISFIIKADLGSSPISSLPYVLSLIFPFTLGTFTFAFNMILIAGEVVILRRNFKKIQLLQIPITFLFSCFIDLTMSFLGGLQPVDYPLKILTLLGGCVILAFGITLEVYADVIMIPGEAFVNAVSVHWKKEFGIVKVCFDTSLMVSSLIISLCVFRRLNGVREGTIICALIVGWIVRLFSKKLVFIKKVFVSEKKEKVTSSPSHEHNVTVTISREYGSGGHEIGQILARKLDISFYDREIITQAAQNLQRANIDIVDIEKNDEKLANPILHDWIASNFSYLPDGLPPQEALFEAERQIILAAAAQGSCVIIGRNADFILKDQPQCFRIFLHARPEVRSRRLMETEGLTEEAAASELRRIDKKRSHHYRYFTDRVWGDFKNYNLCIDTEVFGMEGSVELILNALQQFSHQPSFSEEK